MKYLVSYFYVGVVFNCGIQNSTKFASCSVPIVKWCTIEGKCVGALSGVVLHLRAKNAVVNSQEHPYSSFSRKTH